MIHLFATRVGWSLAREADCCRRFLSGFLMFLSECFPEKVWRAANTFLADDGFIIAECVPTFLGWGCGGYKIDLIEFIGFLLKSCIRKLDDSYCWLFGIPNIFRAVAWLFR